MSIDELLKKQIKELTDFNPDNITPDTSIKDIGFDSLDFLSVQVTLQRELNFLLDLNRIAEEMPRNYGDFLKCIELQYRESML